jgi:hypothetical protein
MGRLNREGKISMPRVQLKKIKDTQLEFRIFASYLFGSSSRIKADKLRGFGWESIDFDWLRMVQETLGYRC